MTALTQARNTPEKRGDIFNFPVKATAKIYAGSIVFLSSDGASPGITGANWIVAGRAEQTVDNTDGSHGDKTIDVRRGIFRFANDATSPVTDARIGRDCYVVDDQTVAGTDGTGTRSRAGIVFDVDAAGVWVQMGLGY